MTTIISSAFLRAAKKAQYSNQEWREEETISLHDYWDAASPGLWEKIDGNIAEVICKEFTSKTTGEVKLALKLSVPLKSGATVELSLSSKSILEEGDEVPIDSIKGTRFSMEGKEDIVRYDGDVIE